MKTVNFLEALEANKTRKICLADRASKKEAWFQVKELVKDVENESRRFNATMFYGKWVVEPEVIEFECEWERNELEQIAPISQDLRTCVGDILKPIIGKRTKVRIEVLE